MSVCILCMPIYTSTTLAIAGPPLFLGRLLNSTRHIHGLRATLDGIKAPGPAACPSLSAPSSVGVRGRRGRDSPLVALCFVCVVFLCWCLLHQPCLTALIHRSFTHILSPSFTHSHTYTHAHTLPAPPSGCCPSRSSRTSRASRWPRAPCTTTT